MTSTTFSPNSDAVKKIWRQVTHPVAMPMFMLAKLPLALIAGLRVRHIDEDSCEVTVPYGWRTTNPFKSTYFAALTMAAEMATGALAMATVRASPKPISMLVVGVEGQFLKKATQVTTFRCEAGKEMSASVMETLETGEAVVQKAEAIGTSPDGVEVARFVFTWSFKKKRTP